MKRQLPTQLVGGPHDGDVGTLHYDDTLPQRIYTKWCVNCQAVHWRVLDERSIAQDDRRFMRDGIVYHYEKVVSPFKDTYDGKPFELEAVALYVYNEPVGPEVAEDADVRLPAAA